MKPNTKETELAIASTGTRDSVLYSSGSDPILNPTVTPSFMKTAYDRKKKKNTWDLVEETIAAFDVNEVVSGALKHIVAVLYRNLYIVGENLNDNEIKFWESIKTLSFDINKVPKKITLVQLAQSIGINLIKSGNAFPYITKWGPSWTGIYPYQLPVNISVYPVTSIDYENINDDYKFSIKGSSVKKGAALAQEDLDHVYIPKTDDQVFATPPFYSLITAAQLKNEVDQSIWNVLCSFIAFILHIIVDTTRSDKGPGIRQKRLTQKQMDLIVDKFKGSGKNRAVGTTSDVEAKFITMDTSILAAEGIYSPIDKRLDQALGKIFFGQVLLDSIAYAGLVEVYFQEPVERYFDALFLTIAIKNKMDLTKVPTVKFSPVAWHEESTITDTDKMLHEQGGLSLTDLVERRGLNFDDQMRKWDREIKKYPWLSDVYDALIGLKNEVPVPNKDNQNPNQNSQDSSKKPVKQTKSRK